jgi:hypothetical protein
VIRDGEAADFRYMLIDREIRRFPLDCSFDREITAVGATERKPDGPLRHWKIAFEYALKPGEPLEECGDTGYVRSGGRP